MKMINNNAFSELIESETQEIEGGSGLLLGLAIGVLAEAASKSLTGKGLSDWVDIGVQKVATGITNLFN